jgi:hypothetical protein
LSPEIYQAHLYDVDYSSVNEGAPVQGKKEAPYVVDEANQMKINKCNWRNYS